MPPEQLRSRFHEAEPAKDSPPPIVRFQASATEQEIWQGALRVPDAREHVLACFRQIDNAGEFPQPAQVRDFVDMDLSGNVDSALAAEQERLKEALRERLGEKNRFETRSARLVPTSGSHADLTTDHLAQLCRDVESRMTEIILQQIEAYWDNTPQDSTERAARELKIEQDDHARFGRERGGADFFVGRETELQIIRDYLRNDSPWPLVVHGSSGCGKTALLSRAAQEIHADEASQAEVLVRFIGVTPRSADLRSLLGSLCQELRLWHPREDRLPADITALREEFHEQLQSATPERPLILFLDALDQLSDEDGARLLHWVPQGALPAQVKMVVSCLSDRAEGDPAGQSYAELRRRQLPAEHFLNLDALSQREAERLLFGAGCPMRHARSTRTSGGASPSAWHPPSAGNRSTSSSCTRRSGSGPPTTRPATWARACPRSWHSSSTGSASLQTTVPCSWSGSWVISPRPSTGWRRMKSWRFCFAIPNTRQRSITPPSEPGMSCPPARLAFPLRSGPGFVSTWPPISPSAPPEGPAC